MNNKVSEIEFHIIEREKDDCILRMADLIKEGYTIVNVRYNPTLYDTETTVEPYIHIKLRRKI